MIVGISGYAGSGKNTAAKGLEDLGFVESAFADPMRAILQKVNPIVDISMDIRYNEAIEKCGYTMAKKLFPEIRRLLQKLGTEGGRELFGEDHWIDLWCKMHPDYTDNDKRYVITDVRFLNEARFVKSVGVLLSVNRPGVEAFNDHASERDIPAIADMADFVYENDSTEKALGSKVRTNIRSVVSMINRIREASPESV